MVLLTADEAAGFLKVSKSTIYQRRDIPRYRLPGSRAVRFDQDELLAWAKGELKTDQATRTDERRSADNGQSDAQAKPVDNENGEVYHRNPLYG